MQTRKKKSSLSWSKGDTLFVVAVLLVAVPTSWVLDRAFHTGPGVGSTEEIGTILFKQKVAERKFSSQNVWGAVENRSPVYNFDTIRTGKGASAVVNLQDGTEINLDEQTMVGLELRQKALSVALVTGALAAKHGGEGTSLSIRSQGVGVSIQSGTVTVASQGSGVRMQADSSAQVTSEGRTSTLAADQTAVVTAGRPVALQATSVRLLEPEAQAYVLATGETQKVTFRWTAAKEASTTLQIASDSSFSSILYEVKGLGAQAQVELSEGSYSWRILPEAGDPTPGRRLIVLRSAAPVPREPRGVQSVADTQTALVAFSWTPSPNVGAYRLEIFRAANPTTPVKTVGTTSNVLSVPSLPEGKYLWRVVGLYPFADQELTSPTQGFEVQKLQKLETPQPLSAVLSETKAQFSVLDQAGTVLSWDPVPSAESYEVEIARDPDFKDVVSHSETASNFVTPPALKKGDYYWRVRALSRDLVSAPSATRSFSLVAALPLVGLAPHGEVGGRLRMLWNDANQGNRYKIELSVDETFSVPVSQEVVPEGNLGIRRAADMTWDKPGRYFWRVSLVDDKGNELAASQPLSFVVAGGLAGPRIVEPSAGASLDINALSSLVFRWTPVPGADFYRFTLFQSLAGSQKLVLDARTSEPTFRTKSWDRFSFDSYVWKVVAVAADSGGDLQTSPEAEGSFSLTKRSPLQAPALLVPQVLYLPGAP